MPEPTVVNPVVESALTPEQLEEQRIAREKADAIKAAEEAEKALKKDKEKVLEDLVAQGILKKVHGVYVDAKFDVKLTKEFKDLQNKHIQNVNDTKDSISKLETDLADTKKKLMSKEELEKAEKEELQAKVSKISTDLEIEKKNSQNAQVELLKNQLAGAKGLPVTYLKYVHGNTPEELEASITQVMEDYKLAADKITKDEADKMAKSAAEEAVIKTKKDTEEALRKRGNSTEGAGIEPGHIFSRSEIREMKPEVYKIHRDEIRKQQDSGQIKNE